MMQAADLKDMPDGARRKDCRCDGCAAAAFIFLSNEEGSGISDAIIHPQLYEQNRPTVTRRKFLSVDGVLQNQDGVINLWALAAVDVGDVHVVSHDSN